VPIEYDPLLAKLVGYAGTREEAIARLRRALGEYFVGGIKTNLSLFRRILQDPEFLAGRLDTGFLDRLLAEGAATEKAPDERAEIAAVAAAIFSVLDPVTPRVANGASVDGAGSMKPPESQWKKAGRVEALRGR
jgi:acetyl-CoA carboxylase biotin carboxylase subunit